MGKVSRIVLGLACFAAGFQVGTITGVNTPVSSVRTDTLVVRDTIRLPVPEPVQVTEVRRDTVRIETSAADGSKSKSEHDVPEGKDNASAVPRFESDGSFTIPIQRKEYKTEDYTAVVEGWRPELVSMEVYPKTITINTKETRVKKPVWTVTAGVGTGYDGKRVRPNIGITAGLRLW